MFMTFFDKLKKFFDSMFYQIKNLPYSRLNVSDKITVPES